MGIVYICMRCIYLGIIQSKGSLYIIRHIYKAYPEKKPAINARVLSGQPSFVSYYNIRDWFSCLYISCKC